MIEDKPTHDVYYPEKGFVDEKESCIRVPVYLPKELNFNRPIYDPIAYDSLFEKIKKKFPEYALTGRWNSTSSEEGVIEIQIYFNSLKPKKNHAKF